MRSASVFQLALISLLAFGSMGASTLVPAQPQKANPKAVAAEDPFTAEGVTVTRKTVRGSIIAINKRSISVEFYQLEHVSTEMLLPLGSGTRFVHVKGLNELKRTDDVEVTYKQASRKDEKGELVLLATLAQTVTLVKHAGTERLSSSESSLKPKVGSNP